MLTNPLEKGMVGHKKGRYRYKMLPDQGKKAVGWANEFKEMRE
jgi:hypothetical protein